MQLIDANEVYKIIGQEGVKRLHVADIDQIERVDPESLPVVQQLRAEIERLNKGIESLSKNVEIAYKQRDAAVKDIEEAIKLYREDEGWTLLCKFCKVTNSDCSNGCCTK